MMTKIWARIFLGQIFWPRVITSLITLAMLWWWTPIAAVIGAIIWGFVGEMLQSAEEARRMQLRDEFFKNS